jgi:16S rRNA processing protein RimM
VSAKNDNWVQVGRVSGVHGIKGWIKVHSYTQPRDNVTRLPSWVLEHGGSRREAKVEAGRSQGKNVLVKLIGIDDRDAALALVGAEIEVSRAVLPPCAPGEFYWADLEGLSVRNEAGESLGRVDHLIATGAHDVLVLEGDGSKLIPFVVGEVVKNVDLAAGVLIVDWDASYWE